MMGILDRLATQAIEMNNPKSTSLVAGIRPDMPSRFGYENESLERKLDLNPTVQVKNNRISDKIQAPVSSDGNASQKPEPVQLNNSKIKNTLHNTEFVTEPLPQSVNQHSKRQQAQEEVNSKTDQITSPPEEIFIQKQSETVKSHPTTNQLVSPYSSRSDIENPTSEPDKIEKTNKTKIKTEENTSISIPERLQPFIQPFGSYLSILEPQIQNPGTPLRSQNRSSSPDVIIQIDHIEIQVEKKPSKRPIHRESKQPKLTDLSSYLSDQGRRG